MVGCDDVGERFLGLISGIGGAIGSIAEGEDATAVDPAVDELDVFRAGVWGVLEGFFDGLDEAVLPGDGVPEEVDDEVVWEGGGVGGEDLESVDVVGFGAEILCGLGEVEGRILGFDA